MPSNRIRVCGALDAGTADDLRAAARRQLGSRTLVIDLAACTFVDTAGIGALIGAVRRAREAGGSAEVVGASGGVSRALEVSGAVHYLDLREPERRQHA